MPRALLQFIVLVFGASVCAVIGGLAGSGYAAYLLTVVLATATIGGIAFALKRLAVIDYFVLLGICGYIVLNRGFAYIGFGSVGVPIYIGEVLVVVAAWSIQRRMREDHTRPFPAPMWWMIVCALIGTAHLLGDVATVGVEAIRNFSVLYYAIFFPFGYYLALDAGRRRRTYAILGIAFFLELIHASTYAIRHTIAPWITFGNEDVPLLGNHGASYIMSVGALFFLALSGKSALGWRPLTRAAVALWGIVAVALYESRSGLMSLLTATVALLIIRRARAMRLVSALVISFIALISFLDLINVRMKSDRGDLTLSGLLYYMRSVVVDDAPNRVSGQEEGFEVDRQMAQGLAGTRKGRINWWEDIITRTLSEPGSATYGRGFSEILVPVKLAGGFYIRYPHNVYVTVLARVGLVGLACFIAFHLHVIGGLIGRIRRRPAEELGVRDDLLVWALFLISVMVGASFAVVHESPFLAAPLYFFNGFAWALVDLDRRGLLDVAPAVVAPVRVETVPRGVPTALAPEFRPTV